MTRKILTIAALSLVATTAFANNSFTPTQQQDIEQIVHSYLVAHPEVLVEAAQALQAQQSEQQQDSVTKVIAANKAQLFHDPNTPSFHAKNTKAYLVEFFDYQCGHCRSVAPEVKAVMAENKNLTVIFKELPIFGDSSDYAARMALIANNHGDYLALHDALFATIDTLSKQKVNDLAVQAGLSTADFASEINNPIYEKRIQDNFTLAQNLGIMGTPAFVISNVSETKFQLIPGATDKQGLETAIQAVEQD